MDVSDLTLFSQEAGGKRGVWDSSMASLAQCSSTPKGDKFKGGGAQLGRLLKVTNGRQILRMSGSPCQGHLSQSWEQLEPKGQCLCVHWIYISFEDIFSFLHSFFLIFSCFSVSQRESYKLRIWRFWSLDVLMLFSFSDSLGISRNRNWCRSHSCYT